MATELGRETKKSDLQSANARNPIVVTDSGIMIEVREVQSAKASVSIKVKEFGMDGDGHKTSATSERRVTNRSD